MNKYVDFYIDQAIQEKIKKTITVFETGSLKGDYANIDIYRDGKNKTRQITYGKACTTEQGNLKTLIKMYSNRYGILSAELGKYVSKIGVTALVNDTDFISLLKKAGQDPVMQNCQDVFFDTEYYMPACSFFETNKFTKALSLLVIYDSYIHSGRVKKSLRNLFDEVPPALGGDEKKWISSYVDVRHNWLMQGGALDENGKPVTPILKNTVYRTECFKDIIDNDNWDLQNPYNANGIQIV